MGLFDKKTKNTTTVNETNQSITDNRVGGDEAIFGGNVSFGNNANGIEVMTTDFGAIDRAFDSFDQVVKSQDSNSARTLSAIKANSENTINTLKDFAQTLKVGDIEGAKYIAFAIIAAVMIVLVVYMWKS